MHEGEIYDLYEIDMNKTMWCFDMELFYLSMADDNNTRGGKMVRRINEYKRFSYRINGVVTLAIIIFGFVGSGMLLAQIRNSRLFSHRLSVHMVMLCVWDTLLLLSCLLTYCIPSLIFQITPVFGTMAYILFVFQPVASMCVSGTIWQVLAITLERYLAVTRPLEQRTRKAQFGVRSICLGIALFVGTLNLLPIPFDRGLVYCFEVLDADKVRISTLLKPYDDEITRQKISMLLKIIPDIIFRAPLPIIVILVLTVQTIRVCNRRSFMSLTINNRHNFFRSTIPLRLSLLSFKFILCNSLYMFNSVLIEVMGVGRSDVGVNENVHYMDQYMNTFYLSDASNMLLVLHSATNWLIFFHWPRFKQLRPKSNSISTCYTSVQQVNVSTAMLILKKFTPVKHRVGKDILNKLCVELPPVSELIIGSPFVSKSQLNCIEVEKRLHYLGGKLGDFIEQTLKWFADRSSSYSNLREKCRAAGHAHFESNVHLTADQWKLVRAVVVRALLVNTVKKSFTKEREINTDNIEDTLTRAFNFILSETRCGLLCASVEATKRMRRSRSSSLVAWRGSSGTVTVMARPLLESTDDD